MLSLKFIKYLKTCRTVLDKTNKIQQNSLRIEENNLFL